MGTVMFLLRTLGVTILLVILLQIQWGEKPLEEHVMSFLTGSQFSRTIDTTAKGTVVFIRNTWSKVTRSVNTNFMQSMRNENQPGSRQSKFIIERSPKSIREKSVDVEEAKASATDMFEKFRSKTMDVSKKIRSKFIDETHTPGQVDQRSLGRTDSRSKNQASSTDDEGLIEE